MRRRGFCRVGENQRGVVLVLVLWAGALLSVLVSGFMFGTRADQMSAIDAGARLQAEVLAESAVNRALLALLETEGAARRELHGRMYELPFAGGTLRAVIQAEAGKIDLNAAPDSVIRGLIETAHAGLPGNADALSAAVLDWRDADAVARPGGAEDPAYRAAGQMSGAGDRAFFSVYELNRVLGMSASLFERLRPVATVHTHAAQIDPMTASEFALLAVPGLRRGQVDAFLAGRKRALAAAKDGIDTNLLQPLADAKPHFAQSGSDVYTILAEGRTADGVVAFRQAVVRAESGAERGYRVLAWRSDSIPVMLMHRS